MTQPQLVGVDGAGVGPEPQVGGLLHDNPGEQPPVLVDQQDQGGGQQQGVQGAGAHVEQPVGPQAGELLVGQGGDEADERDKNPTQGGAKAKTTTQKRVRCVEPPPFMLNKLVSSKEFLHLTANRAESNLNLEKVIFFSTSKSS